MPINFYRVSISGILKDKNIFVKIFHVVSVSDEIACEKGESMAWVDNDIRIILSAQASLLFENIII